MILSVLTPLCTKKSLTADGDYTYMVYNENDESCEWCSDEDMTLE